MHLLYRMVKIWIRIGLLLYGRGAVLVSSKIKSLNGPLIIGANHPNSFLDAIIIGAMMDQPVHFITRSDVFRLKWVSKMLSALQMLPIYRMRDGKDKLSLNEKTFQACFNILKQNGIVLIFVEGKCENQTHLLTPLKKGAPRMLYQCWKNEIDAKLLPVWISYGPFQSIPQKWCIRADDLITAEKHFYESEGLVAQKVNASTAQALTELHQKTKRIKTSKTLSLFSLLNLLLHAPLLIPIFLYCKILFKKSVHFDSVFFAIHTFTYPFYIITLFVLSVYFSQPIWAILFILFLPVVAYCNAQKK